MVQSLLFSFCLLSLNSYIRNLLLGLFKQAAHLLVSFRIARLIARLRARRPTKWRGRTFQALPCFTASRSRLETTESDWSRMGVEEHEHLPKECHSDPRARILP